MLPTLGPELVMSSYSSLLSLSPAEEHTAAMSSYLSLDADEYYYRPPPEAAAERQGTLFDALQADVEYCVSGDAGSNTGLSGEASEQSQTDASVILGSHAANRDWINEGSTSGEGSSTKSLTTTGSRSGKIAFKMLSDVDVLDDGYRWRKYGKKMVKNSPNPRNYYRCSSEGCHVKKRVERERDDARFVITTYDGVHNHPAAPSPPSRAYLGSGSS